MNLSIKDGGYQVKLSLYFYRFIKIFKEPPETFS